MPRPLTGHAYNPRTSIRHRALVMARCQCGWTFGKWQTPISAEWYWADHCEMERARIADGGRLYR